MKIAILSRKKSLYSTRRLVEACGDRGHTVEVIDTLRCYMNITSFRPEIHFNGEALTGFDAVIPRIGASITFYGTAVLRQFEMMGVYPLNESVAITRSRDKLRSLQLLSRKGIGLPVTGFAHSPDDIQDLIKMVGGAPLVIKLLQGTQGIGILLAETPQALQALLETLWAMGQEMLAGWVRQGDEPDSLVRAREIALASDVSVEIDVPNTTVPTRISSVPSFSSTSTTPLPPLETREPVIESVLELVNSPTNVIVCVSRDSAAGPTEL